MHRVVYSQLKCEVVTLIQLTKLENLREKRKDDASFFYIQMLKVE